MAVNSDNNDSTLIEWCLSNYFFLCSLDRKEPQDLVKGLKLYSGKPNVEILAAGSVFILTQGICDLIINEEKKESLQKVSSYDDTAIIYGTNISNTIFLIFLD